MSDRFARVFLVFACASLMLSLWSDAALAKDKSGIMLFPSSGSQKTQEKSDKALPAIPEDLDKAKINEIMAGLSDDQVRRLLIQELENGSGSHYERQEADDAEASHRSWPDRSNGGKKHQFLLQTSERHPDGAVAVPDFLPKAYADLRGQGGISNILIMFAAVCVAWFGGGR